MNKVLSVVVPAYNVEAYIQECVTSILASEYFALEVIIVDDGSTDETGRIADLLSSQDERVHVLHKKNGGLGAARNSGVRAASGAFLAFVDSDDQVPAPAYRTMIDCLEKSGSDFVVGAVERFNSQKVWKPWFVDEAHSVRRTRLGGNDFPPILWNVFAWSKLFRREFFVNNIGEFPEGVLYEDQEVSAKLFLSGYRFDVIPDVVYRWRARDDNSSITQNKTSVSDLQERLDVARATADLVERLGEPWVIEYWYRKLLNEDLWWYYRVVPSTSNQYWDLLRSRLIEFVERAPASAVVLGPVKRAELISSCVRNDRKAFVKRLSRP